MSRAKRLEQLEQTLLASRPAPKHTLSTRALEVSWQVLERRSFDASAEVIDTVASGLLERPDCNPELKQRILARLNREA